MAKGTGKTLVKKKKTWIAVYGSGNYEGLQLGETLAEKPSDLMGRVIETNLSDISREVKRQNTKLLFKVNNINEGKVMADVVGYATMASHVRRSSQKIKNKMNDSFTCSTKDNVKVQLKPMMMTKATAQKGVLSQIRMGARAALTNEVAGLSYNEMLDSITGYRLQKIVKEKLKKIMPLSVCDIRMMERLS